MARKLRVQYPGALYHVMNRGDRREAVFRADPGRQCFLETLGRACAQTAWEVWALCLRPHHFHKPETAREKKKPRGSGPLPDPKRCQRVPRAEGGLHQRGLRTLRLPFVGEVRRDVRAQVAERGAIATATAFSSVKPACFVTVRRSRLTLGEAGLAGWRGETTINTIPRDPATPPPPKK